MTKLPEDWEERVRQDYRYFLSEEQIQATIDYWRGIIAIALANQRETLAKEIGGKLEKEKAIHKEIETTHDVYPKDWHDGQIEAFSTAIQIIKEVKAADLVRGKQP